MLLLNNMFALKQLHHKRVKLLISMKVHCSQLRLKEIPPLVLNGNQAGQQ
jgi:hypothetical protein